MTSGDAWPSTAGSSVIAARQEAHRGDLRAPSHPAWTAHGARRPRQLDALEARGQLLADLGLTKTHSRPSVSHDNPFSEAGFKTLKYRPDFPERFGCIEDARSHGVDFFAWYNDPGVVAPAAGAGEPARRPRVVPHWLLDPEYLDAHLAMIERLATAAQAASPAAMIQP
jgi:hypothetical protein